ncbi:MAG: hypothetical protein NTX22_00500 [Ignavibacteriales bacterium]|nr:hypothetical protein [Ignavibacteriales bacterium]
MATEDLKLYNEMLGRLENLANGVAKHSNDQTFPPSITETKIRLDKTNLMQKRKDYDDADRIAKSKFAEYNSLFNEIDNNFSGISGMLYNFHGKQNPLVEDYGLMPYKKPGGPKKKKEANPE